MGKEEGYLITYTESLSNVIWPSILQTHIRANSIFLKLYSKNFAEKLLNISSEIHASTFDYESSHKSSAITMGPFFRYLFPSNF